MSGDSDQIIWLLLVEDHPVDALIFTQMCDGAFANLEIVQKRTAQDAAKMLEQHGFNVVFADLNLLDSAGVSSIQDIRKAAPNVPIVALTSIATEQTIRNCKEAGANLFLHKSDLSAQTITDCLKALDLTVQPAKAAGPLTGK